MHKIVIFLSSLALSVLLVSEEKNIEDCTLITEDDSRLICFDSFFKEDTSMILVNKEDIAIYEEKNSLEPEEFNSEKIKIVLKTERSIINENLILNGIKLSGRDFIFELNDKSSWRSIENLRKKDIPNLGDGVELKPGILGSMFLKIKGKKNKIRVKKIRNK
jgi:hypothetical protein